VAEVHRYKGFSYCSYCSYENGFPSPDGRENPFVPGFGTKDLEGQQETAPNSSNLLRVTGKNPKSKKQKKNLSVSITS